MCEYIRIRLIGNGEQLVTEILETIVQLIITSYGSQLCLEVTW